MARCGWILGYSEALSVRCGLPGGHEGQHRSAFEPKCPACLGARSVQVGGPDEFGNIDYDDCPVCT